MYPPEWLRGYFAEQEPGIVVRDSRVAKYDNAVMPGRGEAGYAR